MSRNLERFAWKIYMCRKILVLILDLYNNNNNNHGLLDSWPREVYRPTALVDLRSKFRFTLFGFCPIFTARFRIWLAY